MAEEEAAIPAEGPADTLPEPPATAPAESTNKPRRAREYYPDSTKAWKKTRPDGRYQTMRPGRDIVKFGAITMRPQSDGYMAVERDIARMSQYLKASKPPVTMKGRIFRNDDPDQKPDAGQYEIPPMLGMTNGKQHPLAQSCPVWSFPQQGGLKRINSGLGPGTYNPNQSDKAKAPEYTMRPAMRDGKYGPLMVQCCGPLGPPPAAPKVLKSGHRPNSMPDWSMRGRLDGNARPDLARAKSVPGPGTYMPNVYDNGAYRRPASWGFGTGSRWK
jgi:hypothetical protein